MHGSVTDAAPDFRSISTRFSTILIINLSLNASLMQQQNNFLLLNIDEFSLWLSGLKLTRKIKLVQNHHTWLPDYNTFNKRKSNRYFSLLSSMKEAHLARGFTEIAQNITTFPDGMVAVCRNFELTPAGIKGANLNGLCIEHIGNFDNNKDTMTAAHRKSIIQVNALLCHHFNLSVNTNTIVYHHWYDLNTGKRVLEGKGVTKTCPGQKFFQGNTVEACKANFIPEVEKVLAAIQLKAVKKAEIAVA
jgi:hypothetical protein